MEEIQRKMMAEAVAEAAKNRETQFADGGPFGAVVVKDGEIVGRGHNTVLKSHDPSAHGEVNAIRDACARLGTHDLSGCELYTSAEPCPMCLAAIIWANIKTIYYANTKAETAAIGFRDDMIYTYIKGNGADQSILRSVHLADGGAEAVFASFREHQDRIY